MQALVIGVVVAAINVLVFAVHLFFLHPWRQSSMAMRFLAPIGYFVALLTSTYSVAETWREGHETAPWAEIAVVLYAVQTVAGLVHSSSAFRAHEFKPAFVAIVLQIAFTAGAALSMLPCSAVAAATMCMALVWEILLSLATWKQYRAQASLQNITYVGDADMGGALFHMFDEEEEDDYDGLEGGTAYNAF